MAKQQISISFKNNTKESELFKIINSIEDKAGEIKPILYKYFILGYKLVEENEILTASKIHDKKVTDEEYDDGVDVTDF